ncbi:MAG: methyltransferase domain-containing protein [Betaproteobacteria bacterium]|nr:methyltransferase domain-containing protein [Betaproteobacteria bacterium]
MKLDADVLVQIVARTLGHYHARAAAFWEGTRHHDVAQNIEALLRHVQATPPFTLLDFGCGPGRDLRTFTQRGHRAIGLEGAPALADMARAYSDCEVWQQDFLRMKLPDAHFDGVFANASLFHVPRQELPKVLRQLHASLKPGGVLFSSNPRGNNEERMDGERYGAYYDLATWRTYLADAGFVELEHYYRPAGLPREQQPWLATVWRKGKSQMGVEDDERP